MILRNRCGKTYVVTLPIMQCGKCKLWWHTSCTSTKTIPSTQFFCSNCRSVAHNSKEKLKNDDVYRFILPKENPEDSVIVVEEKCGASISQIQEMIGRNNDRLQSKIENSFKSTLAKQSKEMTLMLENMNKFINNVGVRMDTAQPSTSKHEVQMPAQQTSFTDRKSSIVNQDNDSCEESDHSIRRRYPDRRSAGEDNVKHMRQTLYDLPVFDGEPTKWPKFIAAYRNSNIHAHFNDVENMMRLLKFVKGEALSMIEARLIHPSGVPKAIGILQKTFGDPVLVTNGLVKAIMESETPRESKPSSMVMFSIKVSDLVCYIKAMEEDEQLNNQFLLREILRKLPYHTQEKWEEARMKLTRRANLEDFEEWLEDVAERYKCVAINNGGLKLQDSPRYAPREYRNENTKKHSIHFHSNEGKINSNENEFASQSSMNCIYCKMLTHSLKDCKTFAELTRANRTQFLKTTRRCFYCYEKHRNFAECREKTKGAKEGKSYNHHSEASKVLFRVVPVTIHGPVQAFNTYAIIDDASSVTLIEDNVAKDLKLKISQEDMPLELSWTQQKTSKFKCNKVVCYISGKKVNGKKFKLQNVYTVAGLNLPQHSIAVSELKRRYPYLRDVDMKDLEKVHPTMLLGLEHAHLGIPVFVKAGKFDEPIAMKTKLGWTIHGPDAHSHESKGFTFLTCHCKPQDDDLNELVRYHFTTDSFGIKPPGKVLQSIENEKALEILERKTTKKGERFEAPLLWKDENKILPESYAMAKWRLKCLEQKLNKNSVLKVAYKNKIAEYLEKGYARKVTKEELQMTSTNQWYLPHFPVFNINKPGKMRFVMDAAAKVGKESLNSFLLRGPDLYTSLICILFNFRLFAIAVVGDIAEMFHQILICEEDQPAQRFLWDKDVYQMERMTFGATCSPSTAQYVKNLNAEQNRSEFPKAYDTIVHRTYVDDSLDSYPTEEEALDVTKQMIAVHKKAGFHVTNFLSNSKSIQKELSGEKGIKTVDLNLEQEINTEKVLGMHWCVEKDEIVFKVNYLEKLKIVPEKGVTKREFLRILMSVFDPHGYIGHYTVHGKIILQDVWRSKIEWDEQLKDKEKEKFIKWIHELNNIKSFHIPRCLSYNIPMADEIELHTFSDASEQAFSAVCYLRTIFGNNVNVSLMGSKTRVAPTKMLSIPRLELQGFVLGTRWAQTLTTSIQRIQIKRSYHWTDSKNVICWIESEARNFSNFVAHRVSEIQDYIDNQKNVIIRYVPSKQNPADEATKWSKPIDVSPESMWVSGPDFLMQSEKDWPQVKIKLKSNEELNIVYLHSNKEKRYDLIEFIQHSNWKLLVKKIAWIFRFIYNIKRKLKHEMSMNRTWLGSEELRVAQNYLIKQAQWECYREEIVYIESKNDLSPRSEISKLCPMLDNNGILRVSGRIRECDDIDYDTINPIILKKSHHLTKLIITEFHVNNGHQNFETVVNELRQKFCIPRLRTTVKKIISDCQQCKNLRMIPKAPQMGMLPKARTESGVTPFTYTGIDLLGPFEVIIGRKNHKYWVVLFTCLTIRAIHLELVPSLSTDDFILSFRNFTNIRIKPKECYCDNGTNFVGADRELKRVWKDMENKIQQLNQISLKPDEVVTEWIFNPPAAPHMGGAWERMVRSVKNVLKRLMNNQKLRVETFRSFLLEAMNIINSRPLTYKATDPNTNEAITPNHIIKLEKGGCYPIGEFSDCDISGRKQWRISQRLADIFWKRWVKEYLPDLTRRTKWFKKVQPICEGDVVIIVDDNKPRNIWEKGTVIKIYKDATGQVRSADVKVPHYQGQNKPLKFNTYKRPAVKLAVLEL